MKVNFRKKYIRNSIAIRQNKYSFHVMDYVKAIESIQLRVAKYEAKPRVKRCMARLLGITSEIRSQDDCAPVLGEGLRCLCEVTQRSYCAVKPAGDEYYKQSIWHKTLTYLTPDLPRAWYRKCQLTIKIIFRKHNFRNDHVVTKITKIFYYENLELDGISSEC